MEALSIFKQTKETTSAQLGIALMLFLVSILLVSIMIIKGSDCSMLENRDNMVCVDKVK